jgi:hypothetical protein
MSGKIWIFGDSFVEHKIGWLATVIGDRDSEFRSISGASITHTLEQLLNESKNIQQHDSVIVSYTAPHRHYFNNHHLKLTMQHSADEKTNSAYKIFLSRLWDERLDFIDYLSKVSLIHNIILPEIKSRNVTVVELTGFPLRSNVTDTAIENILDTVKELRKKTPLMDLLLRFWNISVYENFVEKMASPEFFASPNHIGTGINDGSQAILDSYASEFNILKGRT